MSNIRETKDGSEWGSTAWGDSYGGTGMESVEATGIPTPATEKGLEVERDVGSSTTVTPTSSTAGDHATATDDVQPTSAAVTPGVGAERTTVQEAPQPVIGQTSPSTASEMATADDPGHAVYISGQPSQADDVATANAVVAEPTTATASPQPAPISVQVTDFEHEFIVTGIHDLENELRGEVNQTRHIAVAIQLSWDFPGVVLNPDLRGRIDDEFGARGVLEREFDYATQ